MRRVFAILMFLFGTSWDVIQAKNYPLTCDPIDVVLVTHPKDKGTLDMCIEGIRKNGENIGRVIVVSSEKLSDKAEWFNEANYPFSKKDVAFQIGHENHEKMENFFRKGHPVGWYYQQLLKLYAPFVIPHISQNVLIIDSDSVFVNRVKFLNEQNGGLYDANKRRATKGHYCRHASRILPSYKRVHTKVNSVNHHMLFQKPILEDLFTEVENKHALPFWKAFCRCIDPKDKGASEYEIYFNFAFNHTNQVALRPLKRRASGYPRKLNGYKKAGYDMISFHSYMRKSNL